VGDCSFLSLAYLVEVELFAVNLHVVWVETVLRAHEENFANRGDLFCLFILPGHQILFSALGITLAAMVSVCH